MNFRNLLYATMGFLSVIGCSDDEKAGGELFEQQAILYKLEGIERKQADFSQKTAVSATTGDVGTHKEEQFIVALAKENKQDISVRLMINNQEVEKYNRTYKTAFLPFPEKNIELTSTLQIKAGNVTSEVGSVKMMVSEDLKENTPYMFAVTMHSVSGASILQTAKTLFYSVEVVKGQITKTIRIKSDAYLEPEKRVTVSKPFTMEGLIYVDEFSPTEANISTFMGIEGQALMRFGDSGVDPDHLQVSGSDIGIKFKPKKWYHIAMVVDESKTTAYVNGEKVTEIAVTRDLGYGDFYIGRSYNGNRGINAHFSEIRIWKTARSASQISESIYETDAKNTDLYAYWKMNEVTDNKIKDLTGAGRDLIMKGQKGSSSGQQVKITVFEEDNPVKVE
ncbi:DUF1735 and LamG domain-containing protein [Capnocytophaga sp.]|uniref:DUF1735 and LamG domain-containing protein n=1 Tax=Capnocytophaga sp. TaxID=44737 RepID=UPI0026DD1C20|nr:DUF1735 and LamG domain-containing protein [Capnocytophaga sp.]MDO5105979.1 DUF1735 and LamG domain-containing protein [Capnocytophaga sp.]